MRKGFDRRALLISGGALAIGTAGLMAARPAEGGGMHDPYFAGLSAALKRAGITKLSIDLNLPGIVGSLLASEKLDNDQLQQLFNAVAHKDTSAIKSIPFSYRDTLIKLINSAGAAESALKAMEKLDLPESARAQIRDLRDVVSILTQRGSKEWVLTVDATENRGLAYHSGISFSIFAPGAACELGRGGRYRIEGSKQVQDTEATGFTLYVETLRSIMSEPKRGKRIFIEKGLNEAAAETLRADGYITIYALSEYGQGEEEARRQGCDFIYKNGEVKAIG